MIPKNGIHVLKHLLKFDLTARPQSVQHGNAIVRQAALTVDISRGGISCISRVDWSDDFIVSVIARQYLYSYID